MNRAGRIVSAVYDGGRVLEICVHKKGIDEIKVHAAIYPWELQAKSLLAGTGVKRENGGNVTTSVSKVDFKSKCTS